ncbi:hypothetical protein quinque_015883 [Culex quinquefasciatus]
MGLVFRRFSNRSAPLEDLADFLYSLLGYKRTISALSPYPPVPASRIRVTVLGHGMQGGLNDAPIKSPLASGKWDDEEQSEWTTSENQPSGKGTGLKHGACRTTTSNMGGCGPASNNIAQSAKRTPSSSSTAFDRRCRRCRLRRDSLVSEKSEMVRKQLKATSRNNQRFAQVSQIWQSTLNRRT